MDKQSTKKVQLEVLQKRLEAKVKDHGIWALNVRFFQVVPFKWVSILDQSELRPEEACQTIKAKE